MIHSGVFVLLILVPDVFCAGMLESIPTQNDGILTVCVNHQIYLNCSHNNSRAADITQWRFGEPVNCNSVIDQSANGAPPAQCQPFIFDNVVRIPSNLLSSTAVAVANGSLTNLSIECRDGSGNSGMIIGATTLCVVGQLPSPGNLMCENITNGLNVSWEPVIDTSCALSDVYYDVSVVEESDIQLMNIIETSTEITNTQGLQPSTRYTICVRARTQMGSCSGEKATVTCETSESLRVVTMQPSSMPMTDSSQSTTSSPSPTVVPLSTGEIVGIAVVAIIVIAILAFVVIIVIVILIKKFSQDGKKGSDPGVHVSLAADAQQQQFPEYAMVDKSRKIPDEQPTYQDPGSIQHETAPTGDVYAITERKQKKKGPTEAELTQMYSVPDKTKGGGLNYASLDMPAGSSSEAKRPAPTEYAQVNNN